ncbi:hypothetical protein CPIN17260_0994 [Campylobacter pinnipediorum subsp. pinnipediorum]|uniref:hypothetical protein n=1 Tax=Campylobacter pinnipediorum TaxID=1965231 RepID=UPI000995DE14|nr:hypothetical protein [Campylobacter pinnipediorum]AQW81288.1 hypothetical protein CPIN17260_0994 [Campylobacter pinnipediorum subsp. pinnipediorum]
MRKFKVLYPTRIMDKIYKEGETVEFSPSTDRNFIARLQTIKAIEEIIEEENQENSIDDLINGEFDEVDQLDAEPQDKKQRAKKQK